jgi:polyphosphate kinase
MMQRNLNRRVESLVPVTDPRLKLRLGEMFDVNLGDDTLAWEMQPSGSWQKAATEKGINTHARMKELALARARSTRLPSP